MQKLGTSLTIIRHSFDIMRRHPRLLIFQLVGLATVLLVIALFFSPLLLHMSMAEIWHALWSPDESWEDIAPWRAGSDAGGALWLIASLLWFALCFLLSMFVVTVFNVALYSQIIEAMNGGQVSVSRGFAIASSRLRAIAAWSLLAGGVGMALEAIHERVGVFGKWIVNLAEASWSAASAFVIPVMINEPQTRSPVDYLKISASLLKRVWGEGLIGVSGLGMVYFLVAACLMATVGLSRWFLSPDVAFQITVFAALAAGGVLMFLYLLSQIFTCGLYVYATEGVAPGTFDEAIFDRVWTVKQDAGQIEEPEPVRRRAWAMSALVVLAWIACALLWATYLSPISTKVFANKPHLGGAVIDLADLGYRFGLQDLQVAGLFLNESCSACDFSAKGSIGSTSAPYIGRSHAGFRPVMHRYKNLLYLHVYGKDVTNGPQHFQHSLEVLRSRFPGHEYAISVANGRSIRWAAIPGAKSYTVELDCLDCCAQRQWCKGDAANRQIARGLTEPDMGFSWIGEQPGRWRVWPVYDGDYQGAKSDWTYFEYEKEFP